MLLTALVVCIIQLPFDFFGGRVIEGNFRQIDVNSRYNWGQAYLLGVAQWVVLLTIAGALVGWIGVAFPGNWPVIAAATVMLLAFAQLAIPIPPGPYARPGVARKPWMEQVRAELTRQKLVAPKIAFYEHGERSLAGGWSGVGPTRMLWVARTLWEVAPRTTAALIARELGHLRMGHRWLSFFSTVAWTVFGFILANMILPARWQDNAASLVFALSAVMSTWCWISLLFVFPAMGRWQVYSADAAILEAGFTLDEALAALNLLSERNKPDETLPPGIAFVFHPIPPMKARRDALVKLSEGGV